MFHCESFCLYSAFLVQFFELSCGSLSAAGSADPLLCLEFIRITRKILTTGGKNKQKGEGCGCGKTNTEYIYSFAHLAFAFSPHRHLKKNNTLKSNICGQTAFHENLIMFCSLQNKNHLHFLLNSLQDCFTTFVTRWNV